MKIIEQIIKELEAKDIPCSSLSNYKETISKSNRILLEQNNLIIKLLSLILEKLEKPTEQSSIDNDSTNSGKTVTHQTIFLNKKYGFG